MDSVSSSYQRFSCVRMFSYMARTLTKYETYICILNVGCSHALPADRLNFIIINDDDIPPVSSARTLLRRFLRLRSCCWPDDVLATSSLAQGSENARSDDKRACCVYTIQSCHLFVFI